MRLEVCSDLVAKFQRQALRTGRLDCGHADGSAPRPRASQAQLHGRQLPARLKKKSARSTRLKEKSGG